jgi:N-carbamoyl-L-amino-acid hydrolase
VPALRIDAARLSRDLETLATFGANPDGGIDRASFSAADSEARRWLAGRCSEDGLAIREDGIGNLFIRAEPDRGGPPGAAAPIWTGSHLDAVPNGGRFDGAAGVLAAVEVVRRLHEERLDLTRPVEAVVWSDEEGCYQSLLGSTAVADGITTDDLQRIVGRDGRTLGRALEESGRDPGLAAQAKQPRGAAHCYLELHIEQGTLLEDAGADIGVVTGIVGLAHGQVTFHGRADHAGTTVMGRRRDALRAAAAFVLALPRLPSETGRDDAVLTVGNLLVSPGADNIVPGEAVCRLDFRDADSGGLAVLRDAVVAAAQECASEHDATVELAWDRTAEPVAMDTGLQELVARTADRLGYTHLTLPSRAGHDAQKIAALAPAGMVFVPSREGRSHSPDEYTDPEQLTRGADVLVNVVAELAAAPEATTTPGRAPAPDREETDGPA